MHCEQQEAQELQALAKYLAEHPQQWERVKNQLGGKNDEKSSMEHDSTGRGNHSERLRKRQ